MALGAQQPALTRMFVVHGLRLAAIGLACGLAAAFALTRAMSSLLFGISAADPMTYVAVSLGLAGAAALASYLAVAAGDGRGSGGGAAGGVNAGRGRAATRMDGQHWVEPAIEIA